MALWVNGYMAEQKFLQLKDMNVYKKSFLLSNQLWEIIYQWDYLAKETVGKQLIRSVDSISANIAEGFGRYHKKDKIRKLISLEEYNLIYKQLSELPKDINSLISWTENKLTK